MANQSQNELRTVRILCPKLILSAKTQTYLQWLIGSPFFPPLTVVSTVISIHSAIPLESEALRSLIPRGFEVIGALVFATADEEKNAAKAIGEIIALRNVLYGDREFGGREVIAAVADSDSGEAQFFASKSANTESLERISSIIFEEHPQKYVWERGCLLRCEVPIKLPIYYPIHKPSDAEKMFEHGIEAVVAKLKDPESVYFVGAVQRISTGLSKSRVLRGVDLDFSLGLSDPHISNESSQESDADSVLCTDFCLNDKFGSPIYSVENADKILVSVLLNTSVKSSKAIAPVAEYFPALEVTRLMTLEFTLEVLAYAAKDLPLKLAVSKLVVPGLIDQLSIMKNAFLPNLLGKHPELRTFHFSPPGYIHPISVTYELNYGETELKQVEVRKSLHSRLGLPFDRPLLRTANALNLGSIDERRNMQKGSTFLKDVHIGIPSSGVTGGMVSLVQGSYEYYHYMHNAFNDSGWGCAYRSLQTIISWFRLQHYTSIEIPSHREIQETLVQIGDREPSFIGSQGWIGAIELSFVLDQLLGVSCKVINVRSGAELPEKCRELALHFETQGTPVMIGGGVLAYTLLGVDYNDASGDCAFLILDPHYTGNDEHKKIVNGGWCGWKKAVDAKGKHFFLHDKFYNLLLPQRPDMV